MNIPPIVWLIVGGVVIAGVSFAWSAYASKKRIETLSAMADELGLSFLAQGDQSLVRELSRFELFSQGRHRRVSNMIHGDAGDVTLSIFDYRYTTGHGKHKHTYRQTVAAVQSTELDLPKFVLRPENLFHKIGSVMGFSDINFESHPKFSGDYLLKGNNEERIRAAFSESVLTHLESQAGICVEGVGQKMIYYRSRRMVPPDGIRALMEDGFKLFSLFRQNDA